MLSSKGLLVVYKSMLDSHVLSASLASMYHGPVTLTLTGLELNTSICFLSLCAISSSWQDPAPQIFTELFLISFIFLFKSAQMLPY